MKAELCVCGGTVLVFDEKRGDAAIEEGIRDHQATERHQAWRARGWSSDLPRLDAYESALDRKAAKE